MHLLEGGVACALRIANFRIRSPRCLRNPDIYSEAVRICSPQTCKKAVLALEV